MLTLLLALAVVGQTNALLIPPNPAAEQAPWLAASLCFEEIGRLLRDGDYNAAQRQLAAAKAELPNPYYNVVVAADREFSSLRFGDVTDDWFGRPRDPFGDDEAAKEADSKVPRELHSFDDHVRLGSLCRRLNACDAAAEFFRRALRQRHSEKVLASLGECLFVLHVDPREMSELVDRFEQESQRKHFTKYLQPLGEAKQPRQRIAYRLQHAHGEAWLWRLRELEELRPHVVTEDEQLQFNRARAEAFAKLGDHRESDECCEWIINSFSHRPEVCGEILLNRAYSRRGGRDEQDEFAKPYLLRIVEEHPECPQVDQALIRLGYLCSRQQKPREAIKYLTRLFDRVEQREDIQEHFDRRRLDLHGPAMVLSRAQQAVGEYEDALKFARLARDKYRYGSSCGVDYERKISSIRARVQTLEILAAGDPIPFFDPPKFDPPPSDPPTPQPEIP